MAIDRIFPGSVIRPESTLAAAATDGQSAESFEKVLGKALNEVNDLQITAMDLDAKLASGQLEYIHQAVAAAEKAELALQLTIQARNKIIEAYQEIMRTQV